MPRIYVPELRFGNITAMGGMTGLNTIPSGNKFGSLMAVVESRLPSYWQAILKP